MDEINEESEIKIEYNESYEIDPLCEDYLENQLSLNTQEHSKSWYKSKDCKGKLLCKFCELKYSTVQSVRHHVKNKHPEKADELCKVIINNKRNHKQLCHICKKQFKNVDDLKLHVKNHSILVVETSCMHCNATFVNMEELQDHMYRKHKKENSMVYVCKICGYRTSKKSHYKQHSNTHNENKALTCQICDYKTNYLPNLKSHERIHSNEKPYLCDFENCDYRSTAKSALNSHQLKHYPYKNMLFCDKCSYSTVYKQSLRKHLDCHKRNSMGILKC